MSDYELLIRIILTRIIQYIFFEEVKSRTI